MSEEVLKELPDSWEWAKLGEVIIKIVGGGTPSKNTAKYWEGQIPWLTIKDMRTRRPVDTIDHITQEAVDESSTNLISADTVIMATRVGLGKVVRVPYDTAINQDLKALITPPELDKSYLEYWLVSKAQYLESIGSGTTVKGIRLEQVKDLDFPFAPLEQQKRIAAKIEELFSHIDAGVAALNKAKLLLKQYRQSVLKAAVTGELTKQWREEIGDKLEPTSQLLDRILLERRQKWEVQQLEQFKAQGKAPKNDKWKEKYKTPASFSADFDTPESWTKTTTDQVFYYVTSGSRGWAKYYSDEGALFLRMGNLEHYDVRLDLSDIQRVNPPKGAEGSRTKVQAGDSLISITADVGMVGIVPSGFEEAYINQHVSLARPVIEDMGLYLAWLLSGDFAKEQFKALQRGATKVGLGLEDIKAIQFGLPPLEEQLEIVRIIEERLGAMERLNREIDQKIGQSAINKQAILAAAFSGELVEPLESDGSASDLLEEIKQQSVSSATKKKPTRRRAPAKKMGDSMAKKAIIDVLKETEKALSAEKLFDLTGADGTSPDELESFYVELKAALKGKNVLVEAVLDDGVKQGDLIAYKAGA